MQFGTAFSSNSKKHSEEIILHEPLKYNLRRAQRRPSVTNKPRKNPTFITKHSQKRLSPSLSTPKSQNPPEPQPRPSQIPQKSLNFTTNLCLDKISRAKGSLIRGAKRKSSQKRTQESTLSAVSQSSTWDLRSSCQDTPQNRVQIASKLQQEVEKRKKLERSYKDLLWKHQSSTQKTDTAVGTHCSNEALTWILQDLKEIKSRLSNLESFTSKLDQKLRVNI